MRFTFKGFDQFQSGLVKSVLVAVVFSLFGAAANAQAPKYELDLPGEMQWSKVTPVGSLLVGGKGFLALYQSDEGDELWVRRDLKNLAAFNVQAVPGAPLLVISELVSKIPIKSRLQVVDLMSGETLWDTGVVIGNNLGGYALPAIGNVIFVREVTGQPGIKSGTYVGAFDLQTGEEKWSTRIGSMGVLPTHAIDDNGFISGRDLSGHPPPLVTEDSFLLFAGGIYSLDLASGALNWHYKLKAGNPTLKHTYAQPIIDGQMLYAAGNKRVVALNLADGTEVWTSKVSKGAIPQLELVDGMLVGRYGGTFSDGKNFTQMKPFGAFVLNQADGVKLWEWKKAKKSITNLAVMPEKDAIILSDKTTLYVLALRSKKANVRYKEKLEFERKMGNADYAAKGIGALGGFLSGGLAGSAKSMAGGGDRSDPPLDVSVFGDQLVVRGQYHVLGFDPEKQSITWSVEFAPPGVSGLALMAMGAVTAGASYGSAMDTSNTLVNNTASLNNAFQNEVSKRSAVSERNAGLAFFLTQEEEGRSLVGLDLQSGERIGSISMTEKEPQFQIDAIAGRVYHFAGGNRLVAYGVRAEDTDIN